VAVRSHELYVSLEVMRTSHGSIVSRARGQKTLLVETKSLLFFFFLRIEVGAMVYTGSPNKFVPDSKGGIVRIQCHYMRPL
jgi:hypothetical protein